MDVALATDPNYLPWCAAVIRSCLDQGDDQLVIHLLHEGALDGVAGVERLSAMVAAEGARLVVHRADPAVVDRLPVIAHFGRAVWLRILLPDLLPDVPRVLYLDIDTLVAQPLQPLFELDLEGAPLAAVSNVSSPQERVRLERLGLGDPRGYFNTGVLLLDLDRLREEQATTAIVDLVARRAGELVMPDQDAMNLVFSGRWMRLHPRWNAQFSLWEGPAAAAAVFGDEAEEARRSPAIVHFEGPRWCKPWHILSDHPWRARWWALLRRTPFADTPPLDKSRITSVLRLVPSVYLRVHLYLRLDRRRSRRGTSA